MYNYNSVKKCFYIGPDQIQREIPCINNHDSYKNKKIKIYQEKWKELHENALKNILTNEWLLNWEKTIPNFGCECYQGWLKIKSEIFFREQDQFVWSVEVHNEVNKKLNKPILTLEEARAIWLPSAT